MDWYLIAIISALFSALAAILQKKVLFDIDVEIFTIFVSFFGLLFSMPLLSVIDFSLISSISLLILFGKSILGAIAFYFVMKAIKNLEISSALPLMSLSPGLVAIFAFFLLRESLNTLEIMGMVLLLVGTYLLETRKINDFFRPLKIYSRSKVHYYIYGALFLFTITSLLDKYLLNQYKLSVSAFIFFQQLFFFIIFFVFNLYRSPKNKLASYMVNKNVLLVIILISLFTLGYRYTQIEALKIAPIALVLSLKRISVLFAAIGGGKIFKEKNLLIKLIATIIILIGAILIARE